MPVTCRPRGRTAAYRMGIGAGKSKGADVDSAAVKAEGGGHGLPAKGQCSLYGGVMEEWVQGPQVHRPLALAIGQGVNGHEEAAESGRGLCMPYAGLVTENRDGCALQLGIRKDAVLFTHYNLGKRAHLRMAQPRAEIFPDMYTSLTVWAFSTTSSVQHR